MKSPPIAFIGGGNMARCLIQGLLDAGWQPATLTAADPDPAQREQLTRQFKITTTPDNAKCAAHAQTIILAVKPQSMRPALQSIAKTIAIAIATATPQSPPLLISIAAGTRLQNILRWAHPTNAPPPKSPLPIIRAMPNTPASVKTGCCALFAAPAVTQPQRDLATRIMQSVGETHWVQDEALLDIVTAVSGSGPAYFFKIIETITETAIANGLPPETAHKLVLQTALGAARLAQQSKHTPGELRHQVTSPGGTTEAALNQMTAHGLETALQQGIAAAITRARELSAAQTTEKATDETTDETTDKPQ